MNSGSWRKLPAGLMNRSSCVFLEFLKAGKCPEVRRNEASNLYFASKILALLPNFPSSLSYHQCVIWHWLRMSHAHVTNSKLCRIAGSLWDRPWFPAKLPRNIFRKKRRLLLSGNLFRLVFGYVHKLANGRKQKQKQRNKQKGKAPKQVTKQTGSLVKVV